MAIRSLLFLKWESKYGLSWKFLSQVITSNGEMSTSLVTGKADNSLCLGVTHSRRKPCMCRQKKKGKMMKFTVICNIKPKSCGQRRICDSAVCVPTGRFQPWLGGNWLQRWPLGAKTRSGWAQTPGSTWLKPSPEKRINTTFYGGMLTHML